MVDLQNQLVTAGEMSFTASTTLSEVRRSLMTTVVGQDGQLLLFVFTNLKGQTIPAEQEMSIDVGDVFQSTLFIRQVGVASAAPSERASFALPNGYISESDGSADSDDDIMPTPARPSPEAEPTRRFVKSAMFLPPIQKQTSNA
jgi:hypothetical protein